jgi:hypothetical protein
VIYFPLNQSFSSSTVSSVPFAGYVVSNALKIYIIFFLGVELFSSRIVFAKSKIVKLLTRIYLDSVLINEFIKSPIRIPSFLNYPMILTESPLESLAALSALLFFGAVYFLGYFLILLVAYYPVYSSYLTPVSSYSIYYL